MLIESGRYDRHLRRARTEYAASRETIVAGFRVVLHLPSGTDENKLIAQARQRGVGLYGMTAMRRLPTTAEPQLVLGFSDTPQRAIDAGIVAVAGLLTQDLQTAQDPHSSVKR